MRWQLGTRVLDERSRLVMAIVNRTPDSFYDRGATWSQEAAFQRVEQVVAQGADIVDIGGIRAAPGTQVSPAEEIRRVVPFIAQVRQRYPGLLISVDTWRAEVAREAIGAGADLVNDPWGGPDPELPGVVAGTGAALVCAHAGGQAPRTRPHRMEYDDVVIAAIADLTAQAERATAAGVAPGRVLIDPAHDFGKNTWHSLEVTRRLEEFTATGWPLLVSLSNKDFIGETLDLPPGERLTGTLAATAVCALKGAHVYRVHQVSQTRQVLDMVSAITGDRPPARAVRGLA